MSSNRITAEQFIAAVEEFEEKEKTTLDKFLRYNSRYQHRHDDQDEDKALVTKFFTHPVIHHYLAREAKSADFLEHKVLDRWLTPVELRIYKLRPDLFPFRKEADNFKFYSAGDSASSSATNSYFFCCIQDQYNNQDLHVTENMDVYEIRRYLRRCCINSREYGHITL